MAINVGDTVRILANPKHTTSSKECHWIPEMDNFVGNVGTVELIKDPYGFGVTGTGGWTWAPEWLELVTSTTTSSENLSMDYATGTRIKNVSGDYGINYGKEGYVYKITNTTSSRPTIHIKYDDGNCGSSDEPWTCYKIISKKEKTLMGYIGKLAKKLLDPDLQTLIKAGYMSEDLTLTEDGRRALTSILFVDNKTALVEAAKEELADRKAEKEG